MYTSDSKVISYNYEYRIYASATANDSDTDLDVCIGSYNGGCLENDWNMTPGVSPSYYYLLRAIIKRTGSTSFTGDLYWKNGVKTNVGVGSSNDDYIFLGDTDGDTDGPVFRWIYMVKVPVTGITIEVR